MTQKLKIVLGITGLALMIGAAVFTYTVFNGRVEPFTTVALAEGRKAPDFNMTDWDGNTVRLSDFFGKPVVINFWASWCPPCRVEMPDFNRVYADIGNEVQFLMINLADGQQETVEIAKRYIESNNFSFPVYFDTRREGSRAYSIRYIPTTLFINKEGHIAVEDQGAINENALLRGIELIR